MENRHLPWRALALKELSLSQPTDRHELKRQKKDVNEKWNSEDMVKQTVE
jgi:hypothetical protein